MHQDATKLEELLSNIPNLHTWDGGNSWNPGGFGPNHLKSLFSLCESIPQRRVIETGAGNSTIVFLLSDPAYLVSIAPDTSLFERIQEYCRAAGISTAALDDRHTCSELILPRFAADG